MGRLDELVVVALAQVVRAPVLAVQIDGDEALAAAQVSEIPEDALGERRVDREQRSARLAQDQPLSLDLELEADPARLLGLAAAAEPLRLDGTVDLRRLEGDLRFAADSLPGELASPWLEAELFEGSTKP